MIIGAVSCEELEHQLEIVQALACGTSEGVFGPASLMWRIDREAAIFLGGGRALLLQLAHPWVAAAIAEHSHTLGNPIGRFHRTFATVFSLVFGSLDQALASSRRLHRRHAAIEGFLPAAIGRFAASSRYRANDIAALQWVHATLAETALLVHDLVLVPLTNEEREQYYAENKLFAQMFGIPTACLPSDWTAFAAYNRSMVESEILTVSPVAREIAAQVLAGAGSWLYAPYWYRALTARMLPARLRQEFGLNEGSAERKRAERALACIRRIYPVLPERLRYVGPYHEAKARLAGKAQPDLATQLLNRFWIGQRRLA
jgi:uncharacterized protein (DUF2236 family)